MNPWHAYIHGDIRVSSFTHPSFNSPLLDEVKTKLYGWIANHNAIKPKSNLSPLELRGRKWILKNLKEEKIFITKADKGGSTLIMNYADVKAALENELFNPNKFTVVGRSSDDQMCYVKEEVKSLTIHLEQRKLISTHDKTLITGLNSNNNPKRAPEYQPEPPYAYPLFKIHKLSITDI